MSYTTLHQQVRKGGVETLIKLANYGGPEVCPLVPVQALHLPSLVLPTNEFWYQC